MEYRTNQKILAWAEEDRPREKMLNQGPKLLTNSELIAIILRSGSQRRNALMLSRDLLELGGNNLNQLGRLSVKQLMEIPGIGQTKALTVKAALELGMRAAGEKTEQFKIRSPQDTYELVRSQVFGLNHEIFLVLFLNQGNFLISKEVVSIGGISSTIVDPRPIFKLALEKVASSIILVHNHPSGNLSASSADLRITKDMVQAGAFLNIKVLDHVIVTDDGYFSMSEKDLI